MHASLDPVRLAPLISAPHVAPATFGGATRSDDGNPVSTPAASSAGLRPSEGICNIGPRIAIRGNISGDEDLVIEGRVEGSVSLGGHLVVAPGAVVEADIEVDTVDVHGQVDGDITATTAITLHESARVGGNLRAPRVVLSDGAQFKGSVEMDVQLPGGLNRQPRR